MPDCNMCWNTWNTLEKTPFPRIPEHVEVCRNCARSMKQVIAFTRHHGFDLVTGEVGPGPQAGSKLSDALADNSKREEEPPDPPAKKPVKRA